MLCTEKERNGYYNIKVITLYLPFNNIGFSLVKHWRGMVHDKQLSGEDSGSKGG